MTPETAMFIKNITAYKDNIKTWCEETKQYLDAAGSDGSVMPFEVPLITQYQESMEIVSAVEDMLYNLHEGLRKFEVTVVFE